MANAMAGAGGSAGSHSLQQSFGPQLKRHMQFAADKPEELSKVAMVQKQVSEVKNVMMDNIEKVLDRGEKIELLVDKTENLRTQADAFQRTVRARQTRAADGRCSWPVRARACPLTLPRAWRRTRALAPPGPSPAQQDVVAEPQDEAHRCAHLAHCHFRHLHDCVQRLQVHQVSRRRGQQWRGDDRRRASLGAPARSRLRQQPQLIAHASCTTAPDLSESESVESNAPLTYYYSQSLRSAC